MHYLVLTVACWRTSHFKKRIRARQINSVKLVVRVRLRPGAILCVGFVVGSHPAWRGFRGVLRFSSLHKNQHSKFQFYQSNGPTWAPVKADTAFFVNMVIYLFYLFNLQN